MQPLAAGRARRTTNPWKHATPKRGSSCAQPHTRSMHSNTHRAQPARTQSKQYMYLFERPVVHLAVRRPVCQGHPRDPAHSARSTAHQGLCGTSAAQTQASEHEQHTARARAHTGAPRTAHGQQTQAPHTPHTRAHLSTRYSMRSGNRAWTRRLLIVEHRQDPKGLLRADLHGGRQRADVAQVASKPILPSCVRSIHQSRERAEMSRGREPSEHRTHSHARTQAEGCNRGLKR